MPVYNRSDVSMLQLTVARCGGISLSCVCAYIAGECRCAVTFSLLKGSSTLVLNHGEELTMEVSLFIGIKVAIKLFLKSFSDQVYDANIC